MSSANSDIVSLLFPLYCPYFYQYIVFFSSDCFRLVYCWPLFSIFFALRVSLAPPKKNPFYSALHYTLKTPISKKNNDPISLSFCSAVLLLHIIVISLSRSTSLPSSPHCVRSSQQLHPYHIHTHTLTHAFPLPPLSFLARKQR